MQASGKPHTPPRTDRSGLLRLRLIGQMEAWSDTSASPLPKGRKTRVLLAVVALSAPRPVLRGRMAELLWSRRPEEQARASLRQEIHRLHDALAPIDGDVLAITRDHLALRPGSVWVDVEELLRATPARPAALALYDGELLEGLDGIDPAFDGWLNGERQRLGDRARSVAEIMLREQTDPKQMIKVGQQLLRIDRTHEGAWRALMRAHIASGERGMAIQAYERCRQVLAEQLDAQPSAETQRLLSEIRSSASSKPTAGGENAAGQGGVGWPRVADRAPDPMTVRFGMRPKNADDLTWPPRRASVAAETPPGSLPRKPMLRDARRSDTRSSMPRGGARVGVMPLQLIGTTPAEAHLSLGLAHDITSALARFRWTWLATSNSLARLAAQGRNEDAIREAFELDFLVDGTVQRSGDRLRASLRLLDLRDGHHEVWSGRFEGSGDDLLAFQDEVAGAAAARIDPEILQAEAQRAVDRSRCLASAYDALLCALSLVGRLERPRFIEAGDLLRDALAMEPDSAALHAWFAYWHLFLIGQGWADDAAAAAADAVSLADRALALDPQDARALAIAGHLRATLQRKPREAIALHDLALRLNPNLTMAWSLSGMAHAYLGELDEADRRVANARRLLPTDRQAFFLDAAPVMVALLRHDHQAAVDIGNEMASLNVSMGAVVKPYLSALGHMQMRADADAIRSRLLALEPGFRIDSYLASSPLQRAADREHLGAGLRLAGVQP